MLRRGRIGAIGVAVAAASWLAVPAPVAQAATPTMATSVASVAVGGTVDVTVTECPSQADSQRPAVWLITGSGPSAVRAASGIRTSEGVYRITVPGWVDPADPAVIAGSCEFLQYSTASGTWWEDRFAYPDVAIDVTAGSGPSIVATLSRTVAAGGQAITVEGSGCAPGDDVSIELRPGTDLAMRTDTREVFRGRTGQAVTAAGDGTFSGTVVLNDAGDFFREGEPGAGRPLSEGSYWVRVTCGTGGDGSDLQPLAEARPTAVQVQGSFPSDSVTGSLSATNVQRYVVRGEGCGNGQRVTLALAPTLGYGDALVETFSATPAADGSWSFLLPMGVDDFAASGFISCGDPTGSGFQYTYRIFQSRATDVVVTDTDPDVVGVGRSFEVRVSGTCDGALGAVVYDDQGSVLDRSASVTDLGLGAAASLQLTAPSSPGAFNLAATCSGRAGEPVQLPVVASDPGPTPAVPIPGSASYTG